MRLSAIPLLMTIVALSACPKGGTTVTSVSATPVDDRPADVGLDAAERRAIRSDVERRLHVLGTGEGQDALRAAATLRLEAALDTLDALQQIVADGLPPRDTELAAIEAYVAYLRAVAGSERTDFPSGEDVLPAEGPWARALQHHDAGDVEAALQEGLAALQALGSTGVDSVTMRVRLGDWAVQAGDHELALGLYESATQAGEAAGSWSAEATRRAASTRALALGPDAAALVEANGLIDQGDLAGAHARLERLLAEGTEPDALADAEELLDLVIGDASDLAVETLARAAAILEGPGPYDDVDRLLNVVGELPEGTFDAAELLRLQGWHRARTGQQDAAEAAVRTAELAAALQDARDLVVAGEYRAALKAFAKLEGSEHQTVARREAREAAETLVREERERAGRLFVAARKQSDPGQKRAELEEVRDLLASLVAEFPDSQYADRLRTNLTAVEREISGLGSP